jgi:hypothetical protein
MYPHAVCFLKLPNKDITAGLLFKQERDNWHQVYPKFKTKAVCEQWYGQEAIWTPHFLGVREADSRSNIHVK